MAKRSSRSRANEAPGAPAEPRDPAAPQAGPSRQRRSTSAGSEAAAPQAIEPQTGGGDIVASEIENPQTLARSEPAIAVESERLQASEPTEEEIRLRAYQRFLERGGMHGDDFNDWLAAERELKKL